MEYAANGVVYEVKRVFVTVNVQKDDRDPRDRGAQLRTKGNRNMELSSKHRIPRPFENSRMGPSILASRPVVRQ